MSLFAHLKTSGFTTTAIDGSVNVSYASLIAGAQALREKHHNLKGQSLAISPVDIDELVLAITAFDGWCKALYMLPDNSLALPEGVCKWPLDDRPEDSAFVLTDTTTERDTATISEQNTRWYLATSGTTGTPKWIVHDFASLSRAIKTSSHTQQLRWGLSYQAARFAGLQVVLQSLLSGALLIDCSSGDIEQRLQQMIHHEVSALSATPSFFRQLLMTAKLSQLNLKQITLGGEIADQALLDTLSQLFPRAKIMHIYASTEAGVGFAVADKKAGFPSEWLQQTRSGLKLKVSDAQHLMIKPEQQGFLENRVVDSEGYIDTEDLVSIEQDRVVFQGRACGVINVGGNKVHPEAVEQVLTQHEDVVLARVYAKTSSVLGQLVACEIVANTQDTQGLKKKLLAHCLAKLARYQIPSQFKFVSHLANQSTGKLSR
ncbi:AMP-binding protein [Glaciecola siphonariae]|uniref:AMP-binding protein n=1 Tax=Glaciecola siphonariae TaxID=521012 RepID=A0ABV9LWJ6_9ALTE